MTGKFPTLIACILFIITFGITTEARVPKTQNEDTETLRVFIFAGQSNMVGSDSSARDVKNYPPFAGCGVEQTNIKYSYAIGRENMMKSNGWTYLKPVNNIVGPELSFGQKVSRAIKAPVAIIKCASGGTHLAGDWNPDNPSGFKLYPIALKLVKDVEGFMWHQGENDMFVAEYRANYARNLKNFIGRWRKDLNLPDLHFYIGELCTKTIWGMDNRSNMYSISLAQKKVCREDDRAEYIPTNHVSVRTRSRTGLHYHYGTLGQLEHGYNYATAYLRNIGKLETVNRSFDKWPYKKGSLVKLFILAGHRNMEGEISFVENLKKSDTYAKLAEDNHKVAFSYSLGGGYKVSKTWEPLGPVGMYDTFGPELSFASNLQKKVKANIAIAKFTHSGSQIIDWTPEGSLAESRNLYPAFIAFVKAQVKALEDKGHTVEIEGIFYHVGENDMCYAGHKINAAGWVRLFVEQSRKDLKQKDLKCFISQQPPAEFKGVNQTDVMGRLEEWSKTDKNTIYVKAPGLLKDGEHILMDTEGVVKLGLLLSSTYLEQGN